MSRELRIRGVLAAAVIAAAVAGTVEDAAAQYFGRNKVQYESFDFRVLKTPHFDIYYYPEEEEAVRDAARMAERWYARLSRVLDHEFEERQPVILYAHHPHFQQTTALSGEISDGTGGVTEAFKQRVIMPFAYSSEETDHVLGHELVHAFQYDISGLGRAGGGLQAAAERFQVPLWFVEGMAEYLSIGPVDPLTAIWLRNAALSGEIPTLEQLATDPTIFPYRFGHAVWAYIGGRWGDAAIGQILKLAGEGVPYQVTFERILNITMEDLSSDWQVAVRRAYLPLLATRAEARENSRGLITGERGGGTLNVAPVLSPDGRYLAFLSERDGRDVELFLADAETGRVIRRLQRGTAFEAHFGSLRYIQSAGTFSPDAKQFAFGALREGRDRLVLVDTERGRRLREIEVPGVGEITSPNWSPDGRTIVFSGLRGGRSDLYAVDLPSGEIRQLTSDAYAELQPAYSPDGRTIAFVTDRFDSDLRQLVYGGYEIGLMDVGSGKISRVAGLEGGKTINPQWSADGRSLFYISSRSGIPNVYRHELETGKVRQVTNLFSGVSGITDMSPALAVARNADRLVFTAFEDKGYNIYAVSDAGRLAGTEIVEPDADPAAAAGLPPLPRPTEGPYNRVRTYLADARTGLPSPEEALAFEDGGYRARLGLDYIGQPQVGVAIGGGVLGGGGLYGGISGLFSDVLGHHTLGAVLQAQGQFDEIGGSVQYLNTRGRWSYGAGIQRIPYVYGYYAEGFTNGAYTQRLVRQRVFDSGLMGFARYPLSAVQRVDFAAGVRRLSQDQKVEDYYFDPRTGLAIGSNSEKIDGVGYNMVEGSAAWVFDSGVFGYTSPIAGQRARLEIAPTFGEIQFVTALADVRRYLRLEPFTLAVRGMHFGRYGKDSEGVFADAYLGHPGLIRGYESADFDCPTVASCLQLNQLVGSRLAVANVELRVPILQPTARGGFPLPIDAHLFYDAGIAWSRTTDPTLNTGFQTEEGKRGILSSAGVGVRGNLFGVLVLEVDYVRALSLDDRWRWIFAIQPGF